MPLAYPTTPGGPDQWLASFGGLYALAHTFTPASTAWPNANRGIFMPIYLPTDGVVTQLWTLNGATASGNLDIGIFDAAGNQVVSKGSTAQSGTSAVQTLDITDTWITAGHYYIALAHSNTTGTYFRCGVPVGEMRLAGCVQQASALALPASITPAAIASAYWPLCGLTYQTV